MIDLEAIKARAEKATAGPWEFRIANGDRWELVMPSAEYGEVQMCDEQFYPWTPTRESDWDFIAHARTDIPALIARVEELESAVTAALWAIDHHPDKNHPMTASEIVFRGLARKK